MSTQNALQHPIEYLKGVGPKRSEALKAELQIITFEDLLTHYPFRYVDKSEFQTVQDINDVEKYYQLRGKITNLKIIETKKLKRLSGTFTDLTGSVELVWFQGYKWVYEKLKLVDDVILYGKPTLFNHQYNFAHPEIDVLKDEINSTKTAFQPVYHSTEKLKRQDLGNVGIRKLQQALAQFLASSDMTEVLPDTIMDDLRLISRKESFLQIHFPTTKELLDKARLRLKFEELFFLQLKLLKNKKNRLEQTAGLPFTNVGNLFNSFYHHHLPFTLTDAQKRVIKEIRIDLGSSKQMVRLLQGDVGSGKTLVAFMSMLLACDNGYQACIMAPTEILAQQHFETISKFSEKLDIQLALLTGSTKASEKTDKKEKLKAGQLHIIVGTHALIEDNVVFNNLGLVIIDEQHRFGVAQRAKLHNKNNQPAHILIMTATPIPRTLAMTLYGELDVSVINELPAGRKPISTMHFMENQRLKLIGFIKTEIAAGRQVYIVYPLIKESEKIDFQNLQQGYEALIRDFPTPQYQISIVHGQMKPKDKEFEMQRFIKHQTQIMVATTVIEVGVNVPNATVMVIESAERFGLSQLHQLRGRVGRGAEKSYCVLMTSYKLSADTKLRMNTMVRTNDGFEISEIDLKLRGPGDIDGTQQSGVVDLKIADLAHDSQIVQLARSQAQTLLNEDPEFLLPQNKNTLTYFNYLKTSNFNWRQIG